MAKKDYQSWDKKALIEEIISLKRRKKFGLVWEDKPEDVVAQCKEQLPVLEEIKGLAINAGENEPTNLLIEGDNYHALSVLNYTHKGKIDVIYIDPPYNTGAKDWKYNNDFVDKNDSYRHSKWLSMMANRLTLAKELLAKNGALICAIDENEINRLGLLVEDIFHNRELHCITIVHNPRGIIGKNFSYTNEYAFFSLPLGEKIVGHRIIRKEEVQWRNLRDNGGESLRTDARNCFYPIIVDGDGIVTGFGNVTPNDEHPNGQIVKLKNESWVYPIDRQGVQRKWRYARQSVESIKHLLRTTKTEEGYEIKLGKNYGTVRTVWQDKRHDSNEHGTKLVHALVPGAGFDFPKSVFNVYDCITPIVRKNKNAVILDFFAGSGTTGHAVSILNKEDGGNRRFILCTNNENDIARKVCHPRIKAVIKGHAEYPDITGIPSNLKYYKTTFVPAKPTDQNKVKLTEKAADMLCVREGTFAPTKITKKYRIYSDKKRHTGIIYDQSAIDALKKTIAKMDGKFSVYIFSLADDDFSDMFADMKNKVKLQPIPEAILRVYRRIFKKG